MDTLNDGLPYPDIVIPILGGDPDPENASVTDLLTQERVEWLWNPHLLPEKFLLATEWNQVYSTQRNGHSFATMFSRARHFTREGAGFECTTLILLEDMKGRTVGVLMSHLPHVVRKLIFIPSEVAFFRFFEGDNRVFRLDPGAKFIINWDKEALNFGMDEYGRSALAVFSNLNGIAAPSRAVIGLEDVSLFNSKELMDLQFNSMEVWCFRPPRAE